jgi:hypothetical protein
VSLLKPTVSSVSRVFIQNLFYNFCTFLQVYTNFASLHYFLRIKSIEKQFKIGCTVPGRIRSVATVQAQWPTMCDRSKGRLGLGLVQPRSGSHGHGVVARSPRGRWWLAGGNVLLASLRGPSGGHRAMRAEAGLTQTATRRWGGGAALRGGVWRRWSWHGGR